MKLIPMKVVPKSVILPEDDMFALVGQIAGECYNSSMDYDRCMTRALNCIKRGHHSPWEHVNITLKSTVDRGVSHALVRHRHCAFQQSSTIYQDYQELEFIDGDYDEGTLSQFRQCEIEYRRLRSLGKVPSKARDVLPNALTTNLIITTNVRQWMYMLQRRHGPGDSDNMHRWCDMTREWFNDNYPRVLLAFETWYDKHPL